MFENKKPRNSAVGFFIVMTRQCLSRRIKNIDLSWQKLKTWESDCNEHIAYRYRFILSLSNRREDNLAKSKQVNTLVKLQGNIYFL